MLETTLPRIERGTLAEKATAALLGYIRAHRLQPGSMLPPEARLAELLGVSRPVVREALRGLKGLGVVAVLNGKGAIVRELDSSTLEVYFAHALQTIDNSVRDLMEVRRGIEGQTARLAAARRSPEEADAMAHLADRMRHDLGDPVAYSKLDVQLHVTIALASGNALFHHMVHSIQSALEDLSLRGMRERREKRSLLQVQELHEEIVERIRAEDPEGAADAMNRHMDTATRVLVSATR